MILLVSSDPHVPETLKCNKWIT